MKTTMSGLGSGWRCLLAGCLLASAAPLLAETAMERLQKDAPSNWSKWGDDDQVGALNYLADESVLTGLKAVSEGRVFTLQIPMTSGSGPVFPGRIATQHFMANDAAAYSAGKAEPLPGGIKYSDDAAFIYLQGTTHVDSLAHAWYGEQVYGGKSDQTTVHGHAHADVAQLGNKGIVGRAVLLDVGRHKNKDAPYRLAPSSCIDLEDLKDTAEAQKVKVNKRDILVIRTGSIARFWEEEPDAKWEAYTEPGLCYSKELVNWVDEMEIPMIASDNLAIEKVSQQIDGETVIIPLHGAFIRDLGVVLSEIWWLDDLAADSAEDGKYDFLLVAAPLKMEGGTGAPVNPVEIK